ncbi:hypothetical protein EHE19_014160 [Ruminiclostridium herbifermentans]|uniref:Uncharacterized protein n=1 Tax=Ruminiclostridium herbifermentans TaxID=2488810 RepID=A0A4U7JLG4_9FIRM|nr:hypothetical protein [Ruminiclostridium herbifermentans]QNU66019.1 hypothetical protein EHE19_014160 [Ruminiclostridium herbifermentans]
MATKVSRRKDITIMVPQVSDGNNFELKYQEHYTIFNPFLNLLELVEYYYKLSDFHDLNELSYFAQNYSGERKYPKLIKH